MRILLVEENGDDVLLLRRELGKAGFVGGIEVARRVGEAEALLVSRRRFSASRLPDLIVVDLDVRGGALSFLEWLREEQELWEIPTVVTTVLPYGRDIRRAYGLGAHAHFVKTIAPEGALGPVATGVLEWAGRIERGEFSVEVGEERG